MAAEDPSGMANDDRRALLQAGGLASAFAALVACASDATGTVTTGDPSPAPVTAAPQPATVAPSAEAAHPAPVSVASVTTAALDDAARRTGVPRADLAVMSAEAVTWPDGSLGCPQPGRMYTQALVPGYRVRIRAGSEVLDYHAGRGGVPAVCPAGQGQEPVQAESSS
jgi:hypothetical protein